MGQQKICFNSSLPRSGSALLQNILAQNPRFYCSPTSSLLEFFLCARRVYTSTPDFQTQDINVMKSGFLGFCKGGLEGWYNAISDKPVCVDRCPGWANYYPWINEFNRGAKVIACIRDLRSIFSSLEKLWRENRHLADADEKAAKTAMLTIAGRASHWVSSRPLGVALTILMNSIQTGDYRSFHIVRFEDLTSNPAETLRKVYAYLEEPNFEHNFENVEQLVPQNTAISPIYGSQKIRPRIQPVPADYNDVLGRELSASIRNDNKLFYQTFYPGMK